MLLCFFSFNLFSSNIVYWQWETSILDKKKEEIYLKHKNTIDESKVSKELFSKHFDQYYNFTSSTWDFDDKYYERKLMEFLAEEKKKTLNDWQNWWTQNQNNNSWWWSAWNWNSEFNKFRTIFVDEDSEFILKSLFWTSDYNKLVRSWILPLKNQNPKTFDFMISLYWYLFWFFVVVWSSLICIFIFFLIQNHKWVLWQNKDQWKYKKFEDMLIWFIIVVVVLFWWIRLYINILTWWMKAFEEDIQSIWIDTSYDVIDLNDDISKPLRN